MVISNVNQIWTHLNVSHIFKEKYILIIILNNILVAYDYYDYYY